MAMSAYSDRDLDLSSDEIFIINNQDLRDIKLIKEFNSFQEKANFTNSFYSDFVISIGFQGAAIKAAFAFHKPIIFFSENRNYFNEAYFFFNKKQNENILLLINELTFNGDKFMKSITNKKEYLKFIKKIELNSKKLFSELNLDKLESAQKIINNIINK